MSTHTHSFHDGLYEDTRANISSLSPPYFSDTVVAAFVSGIWYMLLALSKGIINDDIRCVQAAITHQHNIYCNIVIDVLEDGGGEEFNQTFV